MHPYDRYFFDPIADNYTVQRWLDDVEERYGGVDSILMWPTYTNIGIDSRSQFDLFEAMPGGLPAVRRVVAELHAAGVKVLIPYNPWDSGTARCGGGATCGGSASAAAEGARSNCSAADPGEIPLVNGTVCDARIIDGLLEEIGADGFNGDTMGFAPENFANLHSKMGHPMAIEPEGGGSLTTSGSAGWDTMGWGYWSYPQVMSVDSWKWLDSRRMTNICERWAPDHTDALQYALWNGVGFESWENVWGTWNGITKRDGEQIRRVGSILRFLGGRRYLQSQDWYPFSPTADADTLFASRWPAADGRSVAWTLVNRDLVDSHSGPALHITVQPPAGTTWRFYDLYHGEEVKATAGVLALDVEVSGFGAVLATPNTTVEDRELGAFLSKMRAMTQQPLQSLSNVWRYEIGSRVPPPPSGKPTGGEMVPIPGGYYRFEVSGIEIEGGGTSISDNPYGVDVRYEWEALPNRFHSQWLNMRPFRIDRFPVTQADFFEFLRSGKGKVPADRFHYLKNWNWAGPLPKPMPGQEKTPVTYVGLDEARAYCAAYGKRLPREEEWQLAGQGFGSRRPYPWRTNPDELTAFLPAQQNGTTTPNPEPVDKFSPQSDSVFGVGGMVGNVWQYTDEYQDGHTRSVILRGGSNYRPSGSIWYFPNTPDLLTHNKYMLMNPRYERAGTVGFRCAASSPKEEPPCTKPLCGSFEAPLAAVSLHDAQEFALWGAAGTAEATRSAGPSRRIGEARGGGLVYCNSVTDGSLSGTCEAILREACGRGSGCLACVRKKEVLLNAAGCSVDDGTAYCSSAPQQTAFVYRWDRESAGGVCANATGHRRGIQLNVSAAPNERSQLALFSGTVGASHTLRAWLIDGPETTHFSLTANATQYDLDGKIPLNLKWVLSFEAKTSGAVLALEVSARMPDMAAWLPPPPPPPPPPVPPCAQPLCGSLTVTEVAVPPATPNNHPNLTQIGATDWTHYGTVPGYFTGTPTAWSRKCNVPAKSLIGPLRVIGPNAQQQAPAYANNPTTYSWSDGGWAGDMPASGQLLAAEDSATGVYVLGTSAVPNAGGFAVNVSVPHRADGKPVVVSVFAGSCTTRATISTQLLSRAGAVLARYDHTTNADDGATCSWNALFAFSVPPAAAAEERTLAISWAQAVLPPPPPPPPGAKAPSSPAAGNIQFSSVAVDAGSPARGGPLVPCGEPKQTVGTAVLRAAVLE